MATKKTAPSWSDVKAQLAAFDCAGLLGLMQDLYAASKDNQNFLHTRLHLGGDVLKPYQATIARWLWPDVFKNQDTSAAKAKKAISDYRQAAGTAEGLAELMVFYCEQAAGFSIDVALDDEGYLSALVRMFGQTLKATAALPPERRSALRARLDAVRSACDGIRRDGQQPIIFMQCGPIRHTAARPESAPHDLEVVPRSRFARIDLPATAGIQDVFRALANDLARTQAIATEAAAAFGQGRKVLVLTERTEHLDALQLALNAQAPPPFVLHGRMSKKQRAALITALDTLPPDAPRILLATGKLVGEGFDHPPLDTLVLAMPVSWKGTLQQYAGRLHREHASKADVRIIDFVDTGHPALLRMWDKRQRGYRAMGYRLGTELRGDEEESTNAIGLQAAMPRGPRPTQQPCAPAPTR